MALNPKFLKIAELLLPEAAQIIPVLLHNSKNSQIEAVILTDIGAILPALEGAGQPAAVKPAPVPVLHTPAAAAPVRP